MKKLLQLFSKQALLLCLILISSMSWGQTITYTHTLNSTTWTNGQSSSTATLNGIDWSLNSTGGSFGGYDSTKGHQFGSGNTVMTSAVLSSNGITETISAIRLSSSTASSGTAKITSVKVGGVDFTPTNQSLTTSNTSYAFTGSGSGEIVITWTNTSKAFYLKKIEVDYSIAATAAPEVTAATVNGSYNTAVNYPVIASNSPASYAIVLGALPNGLSMNGTTGVIAGTPTEVGSFSINVTATNDVGTSAAATINFEIAKANQTITFEELADLTYGAADFNLAATSSSGLPLTYTSSNTAVATVLGTTVTVIGMGTTDITASQAGNTYYFAAADAVQSLMVTAKELTVTGLTANDKLQDGTTAATLSGTASLNGIVAGDETDVVLSGTPTATFASALPETGITVSVTGYTLAGAKASNYSLTQPELTATITALEIPVATPATTVTTDSFTANWNAVPGATGYELDVYTVDAGAPATTITETFTAIGGGTSSSYNTRAWTGNGGIEWTAYKARTDQEIVDGNEAITLRDEAGAYLQSGVITGGLSNISFEVKQFFNGSGGVVTVKVLTGPTFAIVTTLGTKSYTTTASSYDSGFISGITGDFKILIESNASARAGIDNLSFTGLSTSTVTYVFQNQNVGNVTSYEVSGLNPNTHYFYVVRAVNGTASLNSNEIEVTTAAPAAITWNGTSWSNTTGPDATLDAVIDGNYNETANITAKNLTVAAGVVVTVAPTSVLTVSGDLVNNGTLVFESTAAGTASFAPYNGAPISGTGTATVERYIPAKRAWRFLTAPLQGTTNNELVANWQGTADEGMLLFAPATYQSQTMTGYAVGGIAPNIFKYNTGWQAIPDLTSENLFGATANDTQAYQIFVTGASNSTNIATGATATTLRPNGALITGTVNHALTANAYKLLPNPYASPIDTEAMVANNAGAKVWLLEPSIGFGGYVTYDGLNWSAPTTGNDKYIQSGQGFFVKSTNTSFAIQEALKVTGNSNTWFERNATASNDTKIRVLLYKQDATDWQLADAILAVNSMNGNTAVDAADASKISNYNESLMFRNGTSNLAIEYRGVPQVNEIQPLRLTGTSATPYQLHIYVESFIENSLVPLLEDTLLGTFTTIPTDGSTVTIPFTGVVSNTTNPDDRFRMVYQTALAHDSFETLKVSVYPNPVSNGTLSVNLPQGEDAAFELYNVLGQKVQQGILAATNNSVNVSRLQSGVYVLNIEQSGKKFTTKVIVDAN